MAWVPYVAPLALLVGVAIGVFAWRTLRQLFQELNVPGDTTHERGSDASRDSVAPVEPDENTRE